MAASRYHFVRPIPTHLHYLQASYALEIVHMPDETVPVADWVFRARKLGVDTVCVICSALARRERLLAQLERGFDVEDGTPAGRIMVRLVKDGIAEKARPGRA